MKWIKVSEINSNENARARSDRSHSLAWLWRVDVCVPSSDVFAQSRWTKHRCALSWSVCCKQRMQNPPTIGQIPREKSMTRNFRGSFSSVFNYIWSKTTKEKSAPSLSAAVLRCVCVQTKKLFKLCKLLESCIHVFFIISVGTLSTRRGCFFFLLLSSFDLNEIWISETVRQTKLKQTKNWNGGKRRTHMCE